MKISANIADMMDRARSVGWDLGLSSIMALLNELDNPQDKCKVVHVTGTNGKGSICAFLNSILMDAGIKVGRYTSPAVESEFERYTINGQWIEERDYINLLEAISKACTIVEMKGFRYPSVFEIETALALLYFAYSNCDIVIVEVGMGGLLDATNVFSHPAVCVFASIGLDHTNWLGKNLTEIAQNKAGIIKEGTTIVSAFQDDEVKAVLSNTAKLLACDIVYSKPVEGYELGLKGEIQKQNAAVAINCAQILRLHGFSINENNIINGLKNAKWSYRFEKINDLPLVYLDGAHNPPAIDSLINTIKTELNNKSLTFVVSVLKDKDFTDMFKKILPLANNVVVIESSSERALPLEDLKNTAVSVMGEEKVYAASNSNDAATMALSYNNDAIICFGTFTFLKDMKYSFKELF